MTKAQTSFSKYHSKNPAVYELFDLFTKEMLALGHKKGSAWLVINRVRWESPDFRSGKPFKIANGLIGQYSREWMANNPGHRNFFTTRPMTGDVYA